ncbi:MAG: hypothetical protein ACRECH_07950 [Nitrososphaerales archaeon]
MSLQKVSDWKNIESKENPFPKSMPSKNEMFFPETDDVDSNEDPQLNHSNRIFALVRFFVKGFGSFLIAGNFSMHLDAIMLTAHI